ncbi:zinc finger BED domain-containing protein 1-like [Rhizophagus clarus]|uniref:Zinc finger BED domain-containing protein 1-like n=2 Tax=Rhizophagus clarus TaxID=94130 RepID=A0A8H3KYV1_9GLOM|nr:zinc finger BED domain-containing protein 1-like [Rhizophagus clarus]
MSIQNKKATRQTEAATNRMDSTIINEQEFYIEDRYGRYFIDDIDDIDDNEVESSKNSKTKINLTSKKRKRVAKEPTSFVWKYFKKEENSSSATCHVIKEDGIACGHYYNDGSTTSNLIHHLATKHKIYKPGSAEEASHLKEVRSQPDIRIAIKKRKPKSEAEYKQIRQNVTEFIIDDNQPFYVLQSKSFRKLILSLDEHFEIPCDKSVKVMIGEAFKWSQDQLLELLKVDCIAASITTDFWTSKARHGYIGVTCSWISHDWTLRESLLALQRVKYPHTGEVIKELLDKIFSDWKVTSKLLTMTTDNGSNIKKAGRLMERSISRLPCTVHTLQLTVGKGLNLNSTFYAWERLIELKRAIKFLPGQLKSDLNKDAQKDGEKLEKIMLSDDEWKLIEDLLNLLSIFEDVTRLLSGAKYCTISLMYPAIAALISSVKPGTQPSSNFELDFQDNLTENLSDHFDEEITILDSAEVTIADDENEVEIEVVDLTSGTGRGRKKINISEPM